MSLSDSAPTLSKEEIQASLEKAIKLYVERLENGEHFPPFSADTSITPTDIMKLVTEMLAALDIELFEVGMWQTWGRH